MVGNRLFFEYVVKMKKHFEKMAFLPPNQNTGKINDSLIARTATAMTIFNRNLRRVIQFQHSFTRINLCACPNIKFKKQKKIKKVFKKIYAFLVSRD